MNTLQVVRFADKFSEINEYWNPKIVAELNGQHVRAAKLKGSFVWHSHPDEDEMFWVMKGSLTIEFTDRHIHLNEGDSLVIPKGVEHRPVAEEEVWVLLFEPASTLNTGDKNSELTRDKLEKI